MLSLVFLLQAGAGAADIARPIPASPACAEQDSGDLIADMHCTPRLLYRLDALGGGGPALPGSMSERAFDTATRQARDAERTKPKP